MSPGQNTTWRANHHDIVQLNINGGLIAKSCPELVSSAMAAFMASKEVTVQLNDADMYYSGRCVITDLFIHPQRGNNLVVFLRSATA